MKAIVIQKEDFIKVQHLIDELESQYGESVATWENRYCLKPTRPMYALLLIGYLEKHNIYFERK